MTRPLTASDALGPARQVEVIAYELGMCESTVKVNVRRVMKKLMAKNRTEVAIKSSESSGVQIEQCNASAGQRDTARE
jgi:predicted transcriptional regulator